MRPNLDQNAYEATVTPVTAEGIEVPQGIIDMILADPSKGIVMMEGVRPSTAPLTINYLNSLRLCVKNQLRFLG